MKLLAVTMLVLAALPCAAQPTYEWVRHGGGASVDCGYSIDIDQAGYVYVAGDYMGTALFGADTLADVNHGLKSSTFLAKYSPAGNLLWVRPVGGYELMLVKLDARGHLYIAGTIRDTVVIGDTVLISPTESVGLARFDSSGRFVWARSFEADGDVTVRDITVTRDGSALLVGWFHNNLYIANRSLRSRGQGDVFLAKVSAAGEALWALREGGPTNDNGQGVAVDGDDNLYICGDYGSFGNYAVFGSDTLRPAGGRDAFIAKYSAAGDYLWSRSAGGDWNSGSGWGDVCNDIVCDGRGALFVTGHTGLTATFGDTTITAPGARMVGFIAKYDTDGAFSWIRQFGGSSGADAYGIALDSSGNVYAAGLFVGTAPFGGQVLGDTSVVRALYVTKVDTDGQFRWALPIGGGREFNNYAFAVGVSSRNEVYVTGGIGGDTVRIGQLSISPQWSDMFLVKILDDQSNAVDAPGMPVAVDAPEVYPQPARSRVTLRAGAHIERLRVVDVLGRVLLDRYDIAATSASFDIGSAPPGVYVLHVTYTDGRHASARVLKAGR